MVFGAGDVGQDGVLVAFLHQSHRNSSDGCLQRHTSIHQRKRSAADGGHRRRSVRFQNVGDDAHRVGPVVFSGKHGGNGALSERSVADFAAAGATHEANFSDGKRGEIVVEHEALLGFAFETFETLHVVAGTEGGGNQGLSFAAGKNGAAVDAGKDSSFDPDFANLIELASVGAALVIDDLVAENALAQDFIVLLNFFLACLVILGQSGQKFFFQHADQFVALRFRMLLGIECVGQSTTDLRFQTFEVSFVQLRRRYRALGLADLAAKFVDGGADFLDFGVGEFDRVDHRFFFYFFRARLDHDDRFGGSDNHDVKESIAHFGVSGIGDEAAVDQSNAHGAKGAEKGNIGNGERGGSGVDATDVRIVFRVGR